MPEWMTDNCEPRPMDVISMGRVAVDLYAEQVGWRLADAHSFAKYLGGCAGNIAVGAARLGLKSGMCSCVGRDDMGVFLRETLAREGVDTRLLHESAEHLTGLVLLGVQPPDTFPLMFYRNDCADMQLKPGMISDADLAATRALVVTGTGLSTPGMRATTKEVVTRAARLGTQVVLDIDYRPVLWGLCSKGDGETRFAKSEKVTEALQEILGACALIVGTEEEWCIAGGTETVAEALLRVRALTAATLIVKRGTKGAEAWQAGLDTPVSVPAFPVEVLNVLGAGDAFMAGLLRGLLSGERLFDALRLANACGALVVTRHGCSVACPTLEEVQHFLKHQDIHDPQLQRLHEAIPSRQKTPGALLHADTGFMQGLTRVASSGDGEEAMHFSVLRLLPGDVFSFDPQYEFAALLMSGRVEFGVNGKSIRHQRTDCFRSAPIVLHCPPGLVASVTAETLCELLVTETRNTETFEPVCFTGENLLECDARGKGLLQDTASRLVRTVFDKRNRPASNLVIGEIVSFSGRWSSYPPHHHPQAEIYHYRFSEPSGFAFGEQGEEVLRIRHNDTYSIRGGDTHSHCTAPGYALWTFWAIRHQDRIPYEIPEFKKAHEWTRDKAANRRVWRAVVNGELS
ncbi:5-dehydro-2-deoxygluconokinase [Legionella geestiana]|uniref:5-dehydro-2-deoxygluconokinase n=1 Tax=Legionella geestiana TaxID=45065 RepID=UPI001092F181|nr:5-dehydro-2-deoxygluconokinase [Legionella geestiana]QDQ40904.1 5-dehydro-2-deoxygluconokinase [Legionella geestiana]